MSQQISTWFKEKIKDRVTIFVQSNGGLLDNTFINGDEMANTIKFPIVTGTSSLYKLTGAIEPVPVNNPGLSTVQITMDDYEGTEFWRTQDAYKAGPSEQDALAKLLAKAVRRKRDFIRLDALDAFYTLDGGANITTTGTGVEVPDILHFEKMRAELASYGDDDDGDEVYVTIPEMWSSQLALYKEFANSQWAGPAGTQFSEAQRMKMKTLRGITYIVVPDSYMRSPVGLPTQLYTYMWRKSALGANTVVNMENMSMVERPDLQGTPYQMKVSLSAAAIGIQAKCVRRALLSKITSVVRGP
jgi:Phage capsid protein